MLRKILKEHRKARVVGTHPAVLGMVIGWAIMLTRPVNPEAALVAGLVAAYLPWGIAGAYRTLTGIHPGVVMLLLAMPTAALGAPPPGDSSSTPDSPFQAIPSWALMQIVNDYNFGPMGPGAVVEMMEWTIPRGNVYAMQVQLFVDPWGFPVGPMEAGPSVELNTDVVDPSTSNWQWNDPESTGLFWSFVLYDEATRLFWSAAWVAEDEVDFYAFNVYSTRVDQGTVSWDTWWSWAGLDGSEGRDEGSGAWSDDCDPTSFDPQQVMDLQAVLSAAGVSPTSHTIGNETTWTGFSTSNHSSVTTCGEEQFSEAFSPGNSTPIIAGGGAATLASYTSTTPVPPQIALARIAGGMAIGLTANLVRAEWETWAAGPGQACGQCGQSGGPNADHSVVVIGFPGLNAGTGYSDPVGEFCVDENTYDAIEAVLGAPEDQNGNTNEWVAGFDCDETDRDQGHKGGKDDPTPPVLDDGINCEDRPGGCDSSENPWEEEADCGDSSVINTFTENSSFCQESCYEFVPQAVMYEDVNGDLYEEVCYAELSGCSGVNGTACSCQYESCDPAADSGVISMDPNK